MDPRTSDTAMEAFSRLHENGSIPSATDRVADPKFGTGAVKITPAHDSNDSAVRVWHNLPFINILDDGGTMFSMAKEHQRLVSTCSRQLSWRVELEDVQLAAQYNAVVSCTGGIRSLMADLSIKGDGASVYTLFNPKGYFDYVVANLQDTLPVKNQRSKERLFTPSS